MRGVARGEAARTAARAALVGALVTTLAFSLTEGAAGATRGVAPNISVSGIQDQVRVSMSVPRNAYPFRALVPVTVRIRNLSPQPIQAVNNCTEDSFVAVQVVSEGNRVLYPAHERQIPGEPALACLGGLGGLTLPPGGSYEKRLFVVLYRGTLEASARLELLQSPPATGLRESVVSTPRMRVSLVSPAEPEVRLDARGGVHANLTPRFPTSKRARFLVWYECPPNNEVNEVHGNWSRLDGRVVKAPCVRPTEWHLMVGWPGQSVARVDYSENVHMSRLVLGTQG